MARLCFRTWQWDLWAGIPASLQYRCINRKNCTREMLNTGFSVDVWETRSSRASRSLSSGLSCVMRGCVVSRLPAESSNSHRELQPE
jgi:hypothetical protein